MDAYLFIAVLPYSGYAYTEAFLDMKQDAWITAHVNAYRFFGGVTRILTPDNLKTGVIKNTSSETVVNKSYQEMAEHYGTAIIPARPRKPKDKALSLIHILCYFLWDSVHNGECNFKNISNGTESAIDKYLNEFDTFIRYPIADKIDVYKRQLIHCVHFFSDISYIYIHI